jgi:hypothetical protein
MSVGVMKDYKQRDLRASHTGSVVELEHLKIKRVFGISAMIFDLQIFFFSHPSCTLMRHWQGDVCRQQHCFDVFRSYAVVRVQHLITEGIEQRIRSLHNIGLHRIPFIALSTCTGHDFCQVVAPFSSRRGIPILFSPFHHAKT